MVERRIIETNLRLMASAPSPLVCRSLARSSLPHAIHGASNNITLSREQCEALEEGLAASMLLVIDVCEEHSYGHSVQSVGHLAFVVKDDIITSGLGDVILVPILISEVCHSLISLRGENGPMIRRRRDS